MSAFPQPFLSVEEYLLFEETSETRHEYIDGEMVAMTGASIVHNQINQNISRFLDDALDEQGCDLYTSDMRVKVEDTGNYMYPNVVIVCGEKEIEERQGESILNPTILIEILSHSTEAYDRGLKWAHYKRIPSLQEYIIVTQTRPYVEHYIRQNATLWYYTTYEGLDAVITFPSVEDELSLASLYRKVTFSNA